MPRRPREQVAGGVYHVCARGVDRSVIFRDDDDRRQYLAQLGRAVVRYGWRLLAYCLMRTHVHLLVETPKPNLSHGIQCLHGRYARYFNDRYRRVGHLFEGRYKARRQLDDTQLRQAMRYVALNPVAAGICAKASDYAWSSYRATAGADDITHARGNETALDEPRVFWFLDAATAAEGRRRYIELVNDDLAR